MNNKPKVLKDYDKLDIEIQDLLKITYPDGFSDYLIDYVSPKGEYVTALPFETPDKKYMIRMSSKMAKRIIDLDEDYDDDGLLKDDARESIEEKYADSEYLTDDVEID